MKLLNNLKVIDFTHAYAGPFATMNLADFGAEVIKVEKKGSGDQARSWGPIKDGQSGYYASFNRGKKSIEIDLKSEEGKAIIRDLVKEADVVCENFKSGTIEKLGLGYEDLKKINPDLIFVSNTGYGHSGPLSKDACYDIIAQGVSGVMSSTGFPDEAPNKVGPSLGDNFSGLMMFMGTLMAYYHKNKTGEGQRVDIAMFDTLFAMLDKRILSHTMADSAINKMGNKDPFIVPSNIYEAKDGYIYFGTDDDNAWKNFCIDAFTSNNHQFTDFINTTNSIRVDKELEIDALLKDFFSSKTKSEIKEICKIAGTYFTPVLNMEEVAKHKTLNHRNMIIHFDDPGVGPIKVAGNPMKLSETPPSIVSPSPLLGQDTKEILSALGYSNEKIRQLTEDCIV